MEADLTASGGERVRSLRANLSLGRTALLRFAPLLVGIFAFVVRAVNLGRSYELFIDELTYLRLARSLAFDSTLNLGGKPFFLHPPAWFFIEAGFVRLFNVSGSLIAQMYTMRYLVFLIVRRAAGPWPAVVAALLFSLDPFITRFNSMNMLETSAMCWVLAGYWAISSGAVGKWSEREQPVTLTRPLLAGLFFGLALLTKEMTAFLTLLPLAIIFVSGWVLRRRAAALIGTAAVLVYSIYPLTVALLWEWQAFTEQKLSGLVRFAGLLKTTGFHRPGAPSLVQTMIARLDQYGTTYLLLGAGVFAVLVLLAHRGNIYRLIAILTGSAYAMLAYSVLFGTLEEQFFYYPVVVCVLACTIAGASLVRAFAVERVQQWVLRVALVVVALMTIYNGSRWAGAHLIPDNGYESVLAYLRQNVNSGPQVASVSEVGQAVLEGYLTGPWGQWSDSNAMKGFDPVFVLVLPHDLMWNNGGSSQNFLTWVRAHAELKYVFSGREDNQLLLYKLYGEETDESKEVPGLEWENQ